MTITGPEKYSSFIRIISVLAVVLGILVIAGWFLDIALLKSVLPGFITMKFNTAVCFILLGFSMFLKINHHPEGAIRIANLPAIAVFFYGILSFSQELSGVNLGIDQFLFTDKEAIISGQPYPGRMSQLTAICMAGLGFSLPFVNSGNAGLRKFVQAILNTVTILAFVAITGYLYNVPILYKLAFITSTAVHTATALFFISIAASLLNPDVGITGLFTGNMIGNLLARNLFLQMFIASLFMGYLFILARRNSWVSDEFGIAIFTVSFIMINLFLIWRASAELNRTDIKRLTAEEHFRLVVEVSS